MPSEPKRKTREDEGHLTAVAEKSHLHEDYEYSSGIVERVGIVPLWLKIVYVTLTIWAIYYIIRYWEGDINLPNE